MYVEYRCQATPAGASSFVKSMKHILFSHSYFLRLDPKQHKAGRPYPPLGTLYAAALVRENGYQVTLFDTMFCNDVDEVDKCMARENPDFFVMYDDGFNYLTKMCLTNMREAAFRMIRMATARGCVVVVCSSDAADHFESYLDAGADIVIIGEGEVTLLEVIETHARTGADLSEVQGIAFIKQGTAVRTAPRKVLKDLDRLPLPAWDLVDMEPYRRSWLTHAGYVSINMATTRGCPFKCNWCAKPIYGNRYNCRSPRHVIREIKFLQEYYPFDHIWFCDDIFGLKPGWVHEFADLVEKDHISLDFKIQSRADLLVQEDYVRDLARAGCSNVWMGAESGSQKILDAMDKGTSISQIHEATRLLQENGIRHSFFIQFGYPEETKQDIEMTLAMIHRLLPDELGISISYPLPGTPFYNKVKNELNQKANWRDSDELLLMFSNTYPPSFYKHLHRYVHKSHRLHLAIATLRNTRPGRSRTATRIIRTAASILYYLPASFIARQGLHLTETRTSS